MIGNDIVDIAEAELKSNWQRPRFLEKLFTLHEQQLIQNSDNSFLMVWRLWSMKEAAYKLYTQFNPSRFYNPKAFECKLENLKGIVTYDDFKCYLNTKVTTQYIISEARLVSKEMISECIKLNCSTPKYQSDTIKDVLLTTVSKQLNILKEDLKIRKSNFGIPSIYQNAKKLNFEISISHHGSYGTYGIHNKK